MAPFPLNAKHPVFPSAELALSNGLLAYGGNLEVETLLKAYRSGIFPWYSPGDHYLWWSPNPRCVFEVGKVYRSKSMSQVLKRKAFDFQFDTDFAQVLQNCKEVARRDQEGSWIDQELQQSYLELHRLGFAHSVECWQEGKLVGGLFGVAIGKCFFGESMFSLVSNSSKAAVLALDHYLHSEAYQLFDCQFYNDHLGSLGAKLIPRKVYLEKLNATQNLPSSLWKKGSYAFE
jgi:leucyl/phenylalanyl-tRNA--protein transferase